MLSENELDKIARRAKWLREDFIPMEPGTGVDVRALESISIDIPALLATIAELKRQRDGLRVACEAALEHVTELRDSWMRGEFSERDGKGGTRSNRNVDVEVKLREALAAIQETPQ